MSDGVANPSDLFRYRKIFAAVAVAILLIPLVAMQFTAEVTWKAGDFLVFGGMLLILSALIECAIRFAPNRWIRAVAVGLALAGFLFVWALLATG